MLKTNEVIQLKGDEAVEIIKEVEYMLISLKNIAKYYYDGIPLEDVDQSAYEHKTTAFIDKNKIVHRLSKIRSMIAEKFDLTLGHDDMDDIERAVQDLPYWKPF